MRYPDRALYVMTGRYYDHDGKEWIDFGPRFYMDKEAIEKEDKVLRKRHGMYNIHTHGEIADLVCEWRIPDVQA